MAYHRWVVRRNVQSDIFPRVQRNQVIEHGPSLGGMVRQSSFFFQTEASGRTLRSVSYPILVLPPNRLCTFPEVT